MKIQKAKLVRNNINTANNLRVGEYKQCQKDLDVFVYNTLQ